VSASASGADLGRLLRRLVDECIIEAELAMDGRLSVTDLSRSNAVGLVHVDGRPVIVVKAGTACADDVDPVSGEAAAYRWLAATPATARLAPSPLLEAARGEAIVTRPVLGAVTLHQALASTPETSGTLVAELGRLLGALHVARVGERDLGARRPWILGIPAGRTPAMYAGNVAVTQLIEEIRHAPTVAGAIARIDRTWTARTAIHGDIKFDNVLVAPDRMLLVDWELAGLGEPVWDLAGVVDGLLLPLQLAGGATPLVDHSLVARLAEPAVAAHRLAAGAVLSPSPDALDTAVVARLAQTAVQLAAMGHEHDDAAEGALRILAAATELADEQAGVAPRDREARCPR
jgi:aminoglycoside phosphotransferase (APT) family kinase protein